MKIVLIKNLENGTDVEWLAVQLCSKIQILKKKKKGKRSAQKDLHPLEYILKFLAKQWSTCF